MKHLFLLSFLISSVAFGQHVQSLKRKADGSVEARFKNGAVSEIQVQGGDADPFTIKSSGLNTFPLVIDSSAANGSHDLFRFYEDPSGDGVIQILKADATAGVVISADAAGSTFNTGIIFGGGGDILNHYEEYHDDDVFTVTGIGGATIGSSNCQLTATRIGNVVTITVSGLSGSSGTSSASRIYCQTALPVNFRPVANTARNSQINGGDKWVHVRVETNGAVSLFRTTEALVAEIIPNSTSFQKNTVVYNRLEQ